MTPDEEAKKAEARGYAKGYQAGKRRKKADIDIERREKEERAFRDRVFLAVLPFCMQAQGWKMGDEPITSSNDRVDWAWSVADRATNKRRARG